MLVAVAALGIGSVSSALAQSQMSGPGGLATSPKVRAMLREQPVVVVAQAPVTQPLVYNQAQNVAASPKVLQQLANNAKSTLATPAPVVVSSRTSVPNNLAASPKVREQMESTPMRFEIAPLK